MHKPEFVKENEMRKILWDLKIQTNHLIPARRLDLVFINKQTKKTFPFNGFCHRVKIKESKKVNKYSNIAGE